jgi:hypothetical protein
MSNRQLYDQDFYAWANEQAGLLRADRLSEADIEHIAEEIENLGKSEKRELVSRPRVLLLHLLSGGFSQAAEAHPGKALSSTLGTNWTTTCATIPA